MRPCVPMLIYGRLSIHLCTDTKTAPKKQPPKPTHKYIFYVSNAGDKGSCKLSGSGTNYASI